MSTPQTPTPQDEFLSAEVQAIGRLDFSQFVDVIQQKDIVLNGTAGDLHVEPEALAQFYNDLAVLHEKLRAKMDSLHNDANAAHGNGAGGLLPGAQQAWEAVTEAAGSMAHADSLYGNLLSVDHLVISHMQAIHDTLNSYIGNEGDAVLVLGKAMDVKGPGPAGPAAAPATPALQGVKRA